MRSMIAVACALAVVGCGDSGPPPLPDGPLDARIKALSSNVIEVNEVVKGEALMITIFKPSVWDGKNWTWNMLSSTKDVLSRLNEASKGAAYKRVTFMAEVPTTNNLGQQGKQLGIKMTYSLEKLSGAQWDKMMPSDMAELVDDVSFRPLGRESALEYCNDNVQFARRFCAKAQHGG